MPSPPRMTARYPDLPPRPVEREPRPLNQAEVAVKIWIRKNHGVLTRIADEFKVSVTFVNRIAYNRGDSSKGNRIERKLLSLGCPLIQKV